VELLAQQKRLAGAFRSENLMTPELQALSFATGSVFTPGAPINEKDLFAGRVEQVERIVDAVSQRGYHAILYGERGVGKTSLSNMISAFLARRQAFVISRTNCDISDTFASLWTKALNDIEAARRRFQSAPTSAFASNAMTPDSVRRALQDLSSTSPLIVIFDEFDRIKNADLITAMADTVKVLSDYSVNATILIIGVADSVDELIREHQSIERALIQIPMPRMSDEEIRAIIEKGLGRLKMGIDPAACEELVRFSQGVPYITHLLCIYTCRAALANGRKTIYSRHVEQGMTRSLDQWQQSIRSAYDEATRAPQAEHIYKEVLLACALADIDDFRYFTPAAVKGPLRLITNKAYDTLNFARHLKDLSEPVRGRILQRVGEAYRLRYRIANPIMRPYILMRGIKDKIVTKDVLVFERSKTLL
jgi:AAA ATPase domain